MSTPLLTFVLSLVALGACALPPRTGSLRRSSGTQTAMVVGSSDPRLAQVVCEQVAATGCFARIRCGDEFAGRSARSLFLSGRRDESVAYLFVDAEIGPDRSDWYANSMRSLRYGTTAVRISRRSELRLSVESGRGRQTYRGTWVGSGRAGVYAYLPLYTGLVSTLIGSTMDEGFSARGLTRRCREGKTAACLQYTAFLHDGLSRHAVRMRRLLKQLGCFQKEFL